MRRIPRPPRAIDASASLQSSVRQRILPSPCTHLRTSVAAFSTTPSHAFLVSGKPDKKKHLQSVRRWQKRLLGDSEPIGAHVDPYDPTSPVRIAPEEQGDYEEVLEEDTFAVEKAKLEEDCLYRPVEELGYEAPGDKLMKVGSEEWQEQKRELEMAKEYEKLTGRTYTPLSIDMANEIEDLTGTPYTLSDENYAMAQRVHETTKKPYTRWNFGLREKARDLDRIRSRVAQAVAEIYTLKNSGMDLDLTKFPNRGVYGPPRWVKQVKLYRTESGKIGLFFPKGKTAKDFIKAMQRAPAWDTSELVEEKMLVDEAEDLLEPVLPQESAPTMDPATPAFKREAVVKIDPTRKPFDFMSNRPVPRTASVEAPVAKEPIVEAPVVEEVLEVEEVVPESSAMPPKPHVDLASAVKASRSTVNELSRTVLEIRAQRLPDQITSLRKAARQDKSPSTTPEVEEVKWRHVPVTDLALKFALSKRMFQLTGFRISDPHLSSATTLGDLYGHVCAAAKPQPTTLYSTLIVEGEKARRKAKQQATQLSPRHKADLGDLIRLGNVELRRVKPTKTEKRERTGMQKVVNYALWERKLDSGRAEREKQSQDRRVTRLLKYGTPDLLLRVKEGTSKVPAFGQPVSNRVAQMAKKGTEKAMEDLETLSAR